MRVWRTVLEPEDGWENLGHAPGDVGKAYDVDTTMPADAQILDISFSAKGPTIYFLTEGIEGADAKRRSFCVIGNDCELPDGVDAMHYRGTAKVMGGPTAHVFETTQVEAPAA